MLNPQFLQVNQHNLFVQQWLPKGEVVGACMLVPPFAEELNKSRRLMALIAQGMADQGIAVLLPDLYGTGDSEGDFADASWAVWQDELSLLWSDWQRQYTGPSILVAFRLGALLAWKLLEAGSSHLLAVQPVWEARSHLTQWLRIQAMADKLAGKNTSLKSLQADIARGDHIEVAGYTLSPAISQPLMESGITPLSGQRVVEWVEIVADAGRPFTPAVIKQQQQLIEAGAALTMHKQIAPQFWQTTEISECIELADFVVHRTQRLNSHGLKPT